MMYTASVAAAVIMACAAAMVGCLSEPDDSIEAGSSGDLVFEQASAARLAGSFTDGRTGLSFEATRMGDRGAFVAVEVSGGRLELTVDGEASRYEVDGHGTVLSLEQGGAMNAFARDIAARLGGRGRELAVHEDALVSIAAYWAEAPAGYVHGSQSVVGPRPRVTDRSTPAPAPLSLENDGISCVRRGQSYPVIYDDSSETFATIEVVTAGSNWGYNPVNGGDYSCMGRCGGGCSGFSLYGRYTLDCLEHDACSYRYNATGGGGDENCGDEFYNAFDDFIVPGWYGCGG